MSNHCTTPRWHLCNGHITRETRYPCCNEGPVDHDAPFSPRVWCFPTVEAVKHSPGDAGGFGPYERRSDSGSTTERLRCQAN